MQVKVAATPAAAAFNLTPLKNAFKHKANGSGVFESSQDPIIVGQAGYNSAYGKTFVASGDCTNPAGTNKCDGMARINQQGGMTVQVRQPEGVQPAAQGQDRAEGAPRRDELGGLRRVRPDDGQPRSRGRAGDAGRAEHPALPVHRASDGGHRRDQPAEGRHQGPGHHLDGTDGTQIWKITHNGVDTHPIHFHLFNVQVLNRVTWDNIIIPTEPSELGWKETVRISPLEDTIVAIRGRSSRRCRSRSRTASGL